jgi:hypothetical protein
MRTGYMFDSVVYMCYARALKIRKTVSRSKMSLVAAGPRQFPTPSQVQTLAGNCPSGNNDDDYDNNDVDEDELKALYTSNQQLLVHTGVHSNDSYLDASPAPNTKLALAVQQQQQQTQPQAQVLPKPQPPPQRVFASTQALIQSLVQSKAQSPATPSTVTLSTPRTVRTLQWPRLVCSCTRRACLRRPNNLCPSPRRRIAHRIHTHNLLWCPHTLQCG